jgi:CBS domain-containing protein
MKVKYYMSAPVTTISPDETVHVGDGIMSLGGFRHLPVVRGGELVGILTERDVLRAPGVLSSAHGVVEEPRAAAKALRVADLMSTAVVTVAPETSLPEAAEMFVAHGIGSLPVVEAGRLVGIMTRSDLLRMIADLDSPAPRRESALAAERHGQREEG